MRGLGIATFKGVHNKRKSFTLITLFGRKQQGYPGLTLRELARESGVSYYYLKARLGKLYQWGYVKRRVVNDGGRPVFSYSIAKRGETFVLERVPPDVLTRYISELREYHCRRMEAIRARLARFRVYRQK